MTQVVDAWRPAGAAIPAELVTQTLEGIQGLAILEGPSFIEDEE
jgi:hypothetical protein